jgi:hypothetical protein
VPSFYEILLGLFYIAVYPAGIVIAFKRRKQNPMVALLAGVYFSGCIVLFFVWHKVFTDLTFYWIEHGDYTANAARISVGFMLEEIMRSLLSIILLFAIFGWRNTNTPNPSQEGIPHA